MGGVIVATMIVTPWATVAVSLALIGRRASPDTVARFAVGLTGTGFAIALSAAALTLAIGPVHLDVGQSGVQLDPLSVLLSLLVFGLSAVIQSFAVRYLRGDLRQSWFVVSANALTAATVLLVTAASVLVFALAWVAAGAALVAALATYPDSEQAREGVRRTALRFAIADSAFLAGVAILLVTAGGDHRLSDLGTIAGSLDEPVGMLVASLLVLGALAHSSQIPFHGWLPQTLAAPTPVSALMHAGVVNAGAILLVRFSPVISVHAWLMVAIVLLGGATLVWASAARLVRPDVKGRLVYSTMAQMGFMIMACGLGAYAAAIFHLVAHSLFKSSLFLGAGMGVRRYLAGLEKPAAEPAQGTRRVLAILVAIVVPLTGLVAAELLFAGSASPASLALLGFVAATGVVTLGSALMERFTLGTVLGAIGGMLVLIAAYIAYVNVFAGALDLAPASAPAPAWLVAAPAAALVILEALSRSRGPSAWGDRAYVRALATTPLRPTLTKGLI